ncbi:MAG: DNA repair protein RecN [Candidatus Binataceae bacterium]
MLTELRIRNFAVIEEAALAFGAGLNVLSGETGAGKTILMTALGLLLGDRASPDLIRAGAKEAVVEGIFEFEGETPPPGAEEWLDEGNPRELIVRRVIAESGRTRVTINDRLATVQALARIGFPLVQIYGQHEQQALLQRDNHLTILDRHGGLDQALADYARLYERVRQLEARRAELERREHERADLLEVARFRASELERAALVEGEDETLAAERLLLANATKLAEAVDAVEQLLYTGDAAVIDAVAKAEARLAESATLDPRLKEPQELLGGARANLAEAAHAIRGYAARLEADPARLDQVDARLNELARLKRKYGGTLAAAIAARERSHVEITELEAIGESREAIAAEFAQALAALAAAAHKLSARRSQSAAELARRMNAELKTLGMRSAVFEPRLAPLPAEAGGLACDGVALGPVGCDAVEFYLAPNLGQLAMPLARVASGGELSRVMLALKRLEAQRRGVATLIFDEVDAGIGGAVAEIVGRKLKQLARFHQILCVTHLAQIAAFGDGHFVIEKQERKGVTRSRVITLASDDRPAEIARMLGGDETNDKFLRAARELIDHAAA